MKLLAVFAVSLATLGACKRDRAPPAATDGTRATGSGATGAGLEDGDTFFTNRHRVRARWRWDDESLYCSELVYKLFQGGAGIELGRIERASDMNLDDERVKRALDKRFARGGFDPAEPVVTPDSIFDDDDLVEVGR